MNRTICLARPGAPVELDEHALLALTIPSSDQRPSPAYTLYEPYVDFDAPSQSHRYASASQTNGATA